MTNSTAGETDFHSNENIQQDTDNEDESEKPKPALVLDLDETIIRATRVRTKNPDQKKIIIDRKRFYVQSRPGLKQFLDEMKKYYDIYFFTASDKEYADLIIHEVAPFVPRSHCFYSDSITHDEGVNVKDLTKIGKPLTKVLLVDNNGSSGLYQPDNTIVITSWYGDTNDNILLQELEPVLKEATCESNILIGASKAIETQHPHSISFVS